MELNLNFKVKKTEEPFIEVYCNDKLLDTLVEVNYKRFDDYVKEALAAKIDEVFPDEESQSTKDIKDFCKKQTAAVIERMCKEGLIEENDRYYSLNDMLDDYAVQRGEEESFMGDVYTKKDANGKKYWYIKKEDL